MACMLHNDDDVMNKFSMFANISKITCLDLYITTVDPPTQTFAHPPPISANSFNFKGLDEYITQAVNIELSFEEKSPQFI